MGSFAIGGLAGAAGPAAATAGAEGALLGTAAQTGAAAASILEGFRRFLARLSTENAAVLLRVLRATYPAEADETVRKVAREELDRQRIFESRMIARIQRDLPRALAITDPDARRLAVQAIVAREQKMIELRQRAMAQRALGAAEVAVLARVSPKGAYWVLDPLLRNHTPDCVAMSGHFWPVEVLREIHPPLHPGCGCWLVPLDDAVRMGYMTRDQIPDLGDAIRRARENLKLAEALRALPSDEVSAGLLELSEAARYDRRFAKGTLKGGQFMPRRGGVSEPVRKALRALKPYGISTPAQRAAKRSGSWAHIGGRRVYVPEHRAFRRKFGQHEYWSPPGSTKVYKDGVEWHGDGADRTELRVFGDRAAHLPAKIRPPEVPRGTPDIRDAPEIRPSEPTSFDQYREDAEALGRILAAHYHASLQDGQLSSDESMFDHAGMTDWDGNISVGADVIPTIRSDFHRKGKPTDADLRQTYGNYKVLAHEVSHRVNSADEKAYLAPGGQVLEEGLTEEAAQILAREMAHRQGRDDVVAWARQHPGDDKVQGSYMPYREAIRSVLDEAGVDRGQWARTIFHLKYETDPPDRIAEIAKIAKANGRDVSEADIAKKLDAPQAKWSGPLVDIDAPDELRDVLAKGVPGQADPGTVKVTFEGAAPGDSSSGDWREHPMSSRDESELRNLIERLGADRAAEILNAQHDAGYESAGLPVDASTRKVSAEGGTVRITRVKAGVAREWKDALRAALPKEGEDQTPAQGRLIKKLDPKSDELRVAVRVVSYGHDGEPRSKEEASALIDTLKSRHAVRFAVEDAAAVRAGEMDTRLADNRAIGKADPGTAVARTARIDFNRKPERQRFGDIFDGFEAGGLEAQVRDVIPVTQGMDVIGANVIGDILAPDGKGYAGSFMRTVSYDSKGDLVVRHGHMDIEPEYQDRGFATAFIRHSEDGYREMGVKKVKVWAGSDVGGYAWAKAGFSFEETENGTSAHDRRAFGAEAAGKLWDRPSEDVVNRLAREGKVTPEEAADFKSRFATDGTLPDDLSSVFASEHEIAMFGRDHSWTETDAEGREHRMWLGKAFMLGTSWGGVKRLRPAGKADPGTSGLSDAETQAVFRWAHADSGDIRSGFRDGEPVSAEARTFAAALRKLAPFDGTVYRIESTTPPGRPMDWPGTDDGKRAAVADEWRKKIGSEVTLGAPSSTTPEEKRLARFEGPNVHVVFEYRDQRGGRSLGSMSNQYNEGEDEVVLPPGARFRVAEVREDEIPGSTWATDTPDPIRVVRVVLDPVLEGKADPGTGDYRISHRAPGPDYGSRLDDVEGSAPGLYEHPEWYGTGAPGPDAESIAQIRAARGNPDASVTIYRAAPVDEINAGDWVTLSRAYAEQHAMHATDPEKDMPVWSRTVRARDLYWDGNSINEFGYQPDPQTGVPVTLDLFHGAPSKSRSFAPGVYATSFEGEARDYAGLDLGLDRKDEGSVSPVRVSLANPLVFHGSRPKDWEKQARDGGHDGVVVIYPPDGSDPSNPMPQRIWAIPLDRGAISEAQWSEGQHPRSPTGEFAAKPKQADAAPPQAKCLPPKGTKVRGTVVLIHGGGWALGSPDMLKEQCGRLAKAGFRTVRAKYPLGNIAAAFDAVYRIVADEHRRSGGRPVYAAGISAGGAMAAMLAAKGMVDGAYAWAPPTDLTEWSKVPGNSLGPAGAGDVATQRRYSVADNLGQRRAPLFVEHVPTDSLVPVSQSERLLLRYGPRMKLRLRPDAAWGMYGGHGGDGKEPGSGTGTSMLSWLLAQSRRDLSEAYDPTLHPKGRNGRWIRTGRRKGKKQESGRENAGQSAPAGKADPGTYAFVMGQEAPAQVSNDDVLDLIDEWGQHFFSSWAEHLPPHARGAIVAYKTTAYGEINWSLRDHATQGKPVPPKVQREVDALDAALAKASLPEDATVYRGLRWPQLQAILDANGGPDGSNGVTITEPGFASTTLDEGVAEKFDHDYILKIEVPKGAHAAYIDLPQIKRKGERELLLPSGSRFEIIGACDNDPRCVRMRLVEQ